MVGHKLAQLIHLRPKLGLPSKKRLLQVLVFLLIVSSLFTILLRQPPPATAGWYNDGWQYRQTLTLDNSASTETFTNFAVRVKLTSSNFTFANARSDGRDVIFTDINNNPLAFEREDYDSSAQTGEFWVRIPSLASGTSTNIYMYYGNANAATDSQNPENVWDQNFAMVQHLEETTTGNGDFLDSTRNNIDSTTVVIDGAGSNPDATGQIDGAVQFDGSNDNIQRADTTNSPLDITGDWTIEAWVRWDSRGDADTIFYKGGASSSTANYWFGGTSPVDELECGLTYSSGTFWGTDSTTADLADTTWYYLVCRFDQDRTTTFDYLDILVNGTNRGSFNQNITMTPDTGNTALYIGEETAGWGGNPLDGIMDEVRISNVARSDEWIEAQYISMNNAMITFGTEEQKDGPNLYLKFDEGQGSTANDSSRWNNDGSISGSAWRTPEFCLSGNCLFFDGSNDVVTVTNANSLDMDQQLAGAMTFEAWVKANSDGGTSTGQIFYKGTNTYLRTTNEGSDGYVDLEASLNLATSPATVTVTNGLQLNSWHHVAVGYTDDGDDEITVYIDGIARGTSSNGSGAPASDSNNLLIGGNTSVNFHGFIDDFRVFNSERTATQVKADAAARGSEKGGAAVFGAQDTGFLTKGLVGHWKMDETASPAADSSGNSNNGTWVGSTTNATGNFGNGVVLDGTGDYIQVTDNAIFDFTSSFTLSAWVIIDDPNANHTGCIICHADSTNEEGYSLEFSFDDGNNTDLFDFGLRGPETSASTGEVAHTSGWRHIVGIFDASTNQMRIYLNGEQSGTASYTVTPTPSDEPLRFGEIADGTGNDMDGSLDEIRLYNRALSPKEIQALYAWAPGPAAWWKLDENTGATSVYDSSGNGYTGTIRGNPTWATGKYGSALNLDGDTDSFNQGNATNLDSLGAFSLEAWVYRTSVSSDAEIIAKKNAQSSGNAGYTLYQWSSSNGGNTCLYVSDGTDQYETCTADNATVTLNTWQHIAVVFDNATTAGSAIYINGVNAENVAYESGTPANVDSTSNSEWLCIGSDSSTSTNCGTTNEFNGKIDDVRVYNYARTPKQIVEDMNAGHPAGGSPISSQTIYWKMDEQNGSTLNNSNPSQAGLTGTTSGTAWLVGSSCKINGCQNIDTNSDSISAGDTSFTDSLTEMSISLWLNPQTLTTDDTIVSKTTLSTQNSFLIRTDSTNSDELRIYIASSTSDTSNYFTTSTLDLTASSWQHLAVVYDGGEAAADRVRVYINGRLVSGSVTGTIPTSMTSGSTSALRIGDSDITGSEGLLTYVDEFKIYDFSLTASEVLVDANAGAAAALGGVLGTHNDEGFSLTAPAVWWKLDDNTGGSTIDSSGNNETGTIENFRTGSGGPTWTKGKIGVGLSFDGNDDMLASSFSITETSAYSITFWFNPRSLSDDDTFVTLANDQDGAIYYDTTGSALRWCNDSGCTNEAVSNSNVFSLNSWHHVALTYNGAGTAAIYVNGINSTSDSSLGETSFAGNFAFGNLDSTGVGNLALDALVDDIRVYNYALTQTQANYIYNRGKPAAWYKFDECTGTTIYNAALNANGQAAGMNGTWSGSGGTNTSVGTCTGSSSEARFNGVTGKFQASLDFDAADDVVTISNTSSIDLNEGLTNGFTIAAWIYPSSDGEGDIGRIWDKGTNNYCRLGGESGGIASVICIVNLTTEAEYTASVPVTIDAWNHIAVSWTNDADDELTICVNGTCSTSSATFSGNAAADTSSFYIGNNSAGSATFDGLIDDVRIYPYEMTQAQINALKNEGSAQRFGPQTGSP